MARAGSAGVTVPVPRQVERLEAEPVARTVDVDVDVVVVAYRSRELVLRCLDSLAASASRVSLRVTVVDNDSRDGTAEALTLDHPDVVVIEMGENAGFSRANNRGIAAGSGRHVLVLNPDTEVLAGSLDTLVRFADEHPAAGVVAPHVVNPDGTDQRTARAFPTAAAGLFGRRSPLTRLFPGNRWSARYLPDRNLVRDRPYRVDWVSGAAMLVPRRVLDEVGGFDEGFFLYWEDADLCRRIADAGHQIWCVPAARVVHDEGGTRGHGWPVPVIRWFHAGAYRYWVKHHAPQPWNPLRWAAALLLGGRACLLVTRTALLRAAPDRPRDDEER